MLDQEKREAEQKTAQSRNIEEQSVEAGKTAAGENGKGAEMQKEEPAEKNDQETSVAASEQEKTGKKRKKKAKQAETAKDLPETVMPPKKRKKKIKKWMIVAAIIVILLVVNIATKLLRPASLPALAGSYAQTGDVEQTLDTSGLVSSLSEKTYFSPVSANVAQLPVAVGDNVSAGDLIVGYDLDSIQEQVQKANLELTAARSGYHDSLNKSNEKADEYSQAKHDAEKLYAEANDLRSKVAGLKDQLAQAQKEQAGQEAGNAANQQKIAELQKEAADLETTQAQLELQIAEKQRAIDALEKQIARGEQELTSIKKGKNSEQQSVQRLSRQIASRRQLLDETESQLSLLAEQLAASDSTAGALNVRLERYRAQYAAMVREAYRNYKHNNYLTYIFSSRDFTDVARKITALREVASLRERKLRDIEALTAEVRTEKETLDRRKRSLDSVTRSLSAQREKLQRDARNATASRSRSPSAWPPSQAQES